MKRVNHENRPAARGFKRGASLSSATFLLAAALALTVTIAGCAAAGGRAADAAPKPALAARPGLASAWVSVPAGEFRSGMKGGRVDLNYDFEIMAAPVTNADYAAWLNEALAAGKVRIEGGQVLGHYEGDSFAGARHERRIDSGDWPLYPVNAEGSRISWDGSAFRCAPGYEEHPVVMVTWFGALAFARDHGWRLPTELEWEKAARGTDGRAYPWGNEIDGGKANYYASGDAAEAKTGAMGDTTPVGAYDNASPYGAYDMAGNVWQWTGDVYPKEHFRYLRGGSKSDRVSALRAWIRNSASPECESFDFGFRCARGGQPGAADAVTRPSQAESGK